MADSAKKVLLIASDANDAEHVAALIRAADDSLNVECVEGLAEGMERLQQAQSDMIALVQDGAGPSAGDASAVERAARLRDIVRNSTDGIVIAEPGGSILFVNPAAEALLGRSKGELVGTVFDYPAIPGQAQDVEITRPDGQVRTVEMRVARMQWGAIDADLILLHDITSRKEAEHELERERRFSNAIVDTAGALICVLDPRGRIVRFNGACQKATGYTPEEVAGRPVWGVLIPPEERADAERVFAALKTDSEFLDLENHWLTKDGKRRLISWANTRVLDRSGQVRWIIGTGLDVTEQRQLEDNVRRAARLEAVGQLAGGVAHDFNNLLTAIMGYISLNLPELPEGSRLAEDLRLAMTAAKRASDLTRQLLTFSRYQPSQPECIDLNATIGDVCKMLRHLIEERVEMRVVLSQEPLTVKADPAQLGQVLMNLAVNARDAMPDGGVLTIETALDDGSDDSALRSSGRRPKRWARLRVRDTGDGIPPEVRERIFDPFFTTKAPGQGTGLGLSTVYGIVRQHNGRVDCESQPGAGSAFTAWLPLAEGHTTTPKDASSAFQFGNEETILIVEDEDEVRELASRALRDHGYVVLTAGDGPEALELLKRHEGPLDLLVTDIVMPRMDGRKLAQRVRLAHPSAKIVFISGYAGDALDEDLDDQLAMRMLQKPFSMRGLTRRVREVLDGS